ncbi:possible universal stress protein [Weissella oryzae SG25]|uniref:Possible universal stress protein n=1 Tax=Weissella oryzae (strain DSM 25784 / JCM 18191 / LMG 30913 / SG25) TaxID=1329250 RepID=A0A069CVY7_WEIOS|nr:universal stress protein [Weissella oryzae]GAK31373.1 possible universal stress protein [Weissella oryzae SG25]
MEPKTFKHVLAAVDDSELGQMTLINAIHQAREDDARLTILSVFESDDLSVFDYFSKNRNQAARDDVERALGRYRKLAEDAGVANVATMLAEGEPGEVIVKDVIPDIHPDLVVIGAHSKDDEDHHYFGSQSKYVANNAPVTVMVVR